MLDLVLFINGEIKEENTMFTEEQETKLEILNDGKINVIVITHYLKDGVEIGQDNWGCCLEPHPAYLEYAESFLDEYYINIIRNVWTEEVFKKYEAKMEQQKMVYNQ